jgi:hypothetical protein
VGVGSLAWGGTIGKFRLISGADEGENLDDEEKKKQLDAIREQVTHLHYRPHSLSHAFPNYLQVSEVKNKWKTGDIEKAEAHEAASKEELEELKKGPKGVQTPTLSLCRIISSSQLFLSSAGTLQRTPPAGRGRECREVLRPLRARELECGRGQEILPRGIRLPDRAGGEIGR